MTRAALQPVFFAPQGSLRPRTGVGVTLTDDLLVDAEFYACTAAAHRYGGGIRTEILPRSPGTASFVSGFHYWWLLAAISWGDNL